MSPLSRIERCAELAIEIARGVFGARRAAIFHELVDAASVYEGYPPPFVIAAFAELGDPFETSSPIPEQPNA